MDDSGSPRTPDRLSRLSGSHVQQSEVFRTMTGARGPYNLGCSAIRTLQRGAGLRHVSAHICGALGKAVLFLVAGVVLF